MLVFSPELSVCPVLNTAVLFVTSMMDNHIQKVPIQQVFYLNLMKCSISISGCGVYTAAGGNTVDSTQQTAQDRHILYRMMCKY